MNLPKKELSIKNYYRDFITNIRWEIALIHLGRSSWKSQEKGTRQLLKVLMVTDHEAKLPEAGICPLFPVNGGEQLDTKDIYEMLWLDEPYEITPVPKGRSRISNQQLRSSLKKLDSKLSASNANMVQHSRNRVKLVLDTCLTAKEGSNSSNSATRLELCKIPRKGRTVRLDSEMRYLVSQASYTVRAKSTNGDIRDVLVIQISQNLYDLDSCEVPLLSYMGVVHCNPKEKREIDTVVYGVATDGYQYKFWKIDRDSQVSVSGVYVMDKLYWCEDHDTVESYIEYILGRTG